MRQQRIRAQVGLRYSPGRKPPMMSKPVILTAAALVALFPIDAAGAQPGWGGPYMQPMFPPDYGPAYGGRDPREGQIQTATFVASSGNVGELGHGSIVLAGSVANEAGGSYDGNFEAALIDQLAKAGYRTDGQPGGSAQSIEFAVHHDVMQPPEPPHNPVGGEVSAGVGSHGWGGVGLGLNIDLSKPRGALVATRLEARIRDSATHELLWQGRAQVVTRDRDKHWTPQTIASRLTAALFKGFPKPS